MILLHHLLCKWPFKQTEACLWKHCFPPCSMWIYHTDGVWLTEKQSLPWQSSYTIVVTSSLPVSPHRLSYVLISGLSSPSSSSSGRSNRYDTIYTHTHTRLCDYIFMIQYHTVLYIKGVNVCVCVCLSPLCVPCWLQQSKPAAPLGSCLPPSVHSR